MSVKFTNSLELLAEMPLNGELCELMDVGKPIVISNPNSASAAKYRNLAKLLIKKLDR